MQYVNTCAINAFQIFCDQPKDKSCGRFATYIVTRLCQSCRNKTWKDCDVPSGMKQIQAMVPRFVISHTEGLMHPSLNGVYHFPGKNRHLTYSTMKDKNLASESLFSGYLNHMYYGECVLDMDG